MQYGKPVVVVLAGAFAANALDARYGVKLFTDLPPMSAISATVSSTVSAGFLNVPFYSTVTDDLIEAPLLSTIDLGSLNPPPTLTTWWPFARV
jgi:hypothetical protein